MGNFQITAEGDFGKTEVRSWFVLLLMAGSHSSSTIPMIAKSWTGSNVPTKSSSGMCS